jgi:prevent-host-death family protein
MKTVGIRDLKNRLSEYVRAARSGEAVLVTDRGMVVAELTPPGQGAVNGSVPAGLVALARRGLVTLGAAGDANLYPALPPAGRSAATSADLLDKERGDR